MPHRVPVKARAVTITTSHELILNLLKESLKAHGLLETDLAAAVTILTPKAEEDSKGLVERMFGTAESITGWRLGLKASELIEDVAEMDDVAERIFREINNDFIDALDAVDLHADRMENFVINSIRILVVEVYTRILALALRSDSKLPPTKDRIVWTYVLQTFMEKLTDDRYKIKFKDNFGEMIEKIHTRWVPWVRVIISQINDVQKAKNTVTANLAYMKTLHLQIMRHLVIAISGREGVKELPKGCLADRQIWKTLERCGRKRLEKHVKSHGELVLLPSTTGTLMLCEKKDKDVVFKLEEKNLLSLGIMSADEIAAQNTLACICRDPNVNNLFGLLNLTRVIIGLIDRVDRVINIGNWAFLLIPMMDLEPIDSVTDNYKVIFDKLIDSTQDPYNISGTDIRRELGKYNIKVSGLDRCSIPKMAGLQAKELLDRIRDKLSDAFTGVMKFGQVLNCKIVPDFFEQPADVMLSLGSATPKPSQPGALPARRTASLGIASTRNIERAYAELTAGKDAKEEEEDSETKSDKQSKPKTRNPVSQLFSRKPRSQSLTQPPTKSPLKNSLYKGFLILRSPYLPPKLSF